MTTPSPSAQSIKPALPPPPGVKSNFTDPPTTGDNLYIFTATGLAITTLFLIIHLYTKKYILNKFGPEDVAIVLSYIFAIVTCVLGLEQRVYGLGRHMWDIPATTLIPKYSELSIAAGETYYPSIMCAKLAIILCYLQISTQKWFRVSLYTTTVFVAGYHIAFEITLIFACHPIRRNWVPINGECINLSAVYLTNGILNVISDFIILLLPLPMIKSIRIPLRQKILLAGFFSVGSLACVISVVRLQQTVSPLFKTSDITWVSADAQIWVVIELCVVITCGCLSVIRPFLRHLFPTLMGDDIRELYNSRPLVGQSESTTPVIQRGRLHNIDSSWYDEDPIQIFRAADRVQFGNQHLPNDDMEMGTLDKRSTGMEVLRTDAPPDRIMVMTEVDVQRK